MTTSASFDVAPPQPRPRMRPSTEWCDDVLWHRKMYGQSRFRWAPENAYNIALKTVRGRLEFHTPGQLATLDAQLLTLQDEAERIHHAMAVPLREIRETFGSRWENALALVGVSEYEARVITWAGVGRSSEEITSPEIRWALQGLPWVNPLTEVWELRQVHGMYQAAVNLLEDAVCDLVLELKETNDPASFAPLTVSCDAQQLLWRVQHQRQQRGEPGDPRRSPGQRYETLTPPTACAL